MPDDSIKSAYIFHPRLANWGDARSIEPSERWFTANIGIHHVHHLYARIPYYRLPQVLREQNRLTQVSRVSLLESLRCARLALWDDCQNRLITFREARRLPK